MIYVLFTLDTTTVHRLMDILQMLINVFALKSVLSVKVIYCFQSEMAKQNIVKVNKNCNSECRMTKILSSKLLKRFNCLPKYGIS